jgi:hypothetical protein
MPRDGFFQSQRFSKGAAGSDPAVPTLVWQLSSSERLLLWAWRLWLEGLVERDPARHQRAWSGLSGMLGAEKARRLLDGVSRLIFRCVRESQGEIAFNPSCCRRLGIDEYRLLCLVSLAGQGELHAAYAEAEGLLRGGAAPALLEPAVELAAALEDAGHDLPVRRTDARTAAILRAAEELTTLGRDQAN